MGMVITMVRESANHHIAVSNGLDFLDTMFFNDGIEGGEDAVKQRYKIGRRRFACESGKATEVGK
jgi:hypothetical protein